MKWIRLLSITFLLSLMGLVHSGGCIPKRLPDGPPGDAGANDTKPVLVDKIVKDVPTLKLLIQTAGGNVIGACERVIRTFSDASFQQEGATKSLRDWEFSKMPPYDKGSFQFSSLQPSEAVMKGGIRGDPNRADSLFIVGGFHEQAIYKASTDGAIRNIRYTYNIDVTPEPINNFGLLVGLALKQDGAVYLLNRSFSSKGDVKGSLAEWIATKSARFIRVDPSSGLLRAEPDLSASGGPIQLGFYFGLQRTNAPATVRIRNWKAEICGDRQPEPRSEPIQAEPMADASVPEPRPEPTQAEPSPEPAPEPQPDRRVIHEDGPQPDLPQGKPCASASATAKLRVRYYDTRDWDSSVLKSRTKGTGVLKIIKSDLAIWHEIKKGDELWALHLPKTGAVYDPSKSGAIRGIGMFYRVRKAGVAKYGYISHIMIQNNSIYWLDFHTIFSSKSLDHWFQTADVQSKIKKLEGAGPAKPDFSAKGGPIQFGLLTFATTTSSSQEIHALYVSYWAVNVCAGSPQPW